MRSVSFAVAALVVLLSCGPDRPVAPPGEATLIIRADVGGTSVATVVVNVSAPDIPTTLVFNIPIASGVALGTITVPSGSSRTVAMQAFDAGGVETHSGAVTLNIQPGTNPTISVVLTPLTGDVPITMTLGSIIVTVTPSAPTLAIGATTQLTAAIVDWNGNSTSGTVSWATGDPGIAAVDATGLVTAKGVGSAKIVATFHGAAGAATVTVTP